MDRNLARALTESTLNNGVLSVTGLTQKEIKQLNEELRRALLNSEIPHYRVIGVNVVTGGNTSIVDYVTKLEGVSKSYAELFVAFENLIYSKRGGSISNTDYLMGDSKFPNDWGYLLAIDNNITSSNGTIFFEGQGGCPVESLINDADIVKFTKSSCVLHCIIRKGTGMLDFYESGCMLRYSSYKPVRAVYDLTEVFGIKLYDEFDKAIHLRYKKNINERILLEILQDFGKDNME